MSRLDRDSVVSLSSPYRHLIVTLAAHCPDILGVLESVPVMGIPFFSSNPLPKWSFIGLWIGLWIGLLIGSIGGLFGSTHLAGLDEDIVPIDFSDQVRPILSQHCFACHGPDQKSRKAGLSLLDEVSATASMTRAESSRRPAPLNRDTGRSLPGIVRRVNCGFASPRRKIRCRRARNTMN